MTKCSSEAAASYISKTTQNLSSLRHHGRRTGLPNASSEVPDLSAITRHYPEEPAVFEIRVICDRAEADRISRTLADMFDTQRARQYPARDGERVRLYFTADHQPTTPESE
ncbi:hypothetical protein [Streptomyces sp. ICBB 8177]|uniref:hypothetical protein n=1 Tax=Streptomyces sp. ICBB 8177 TaxID=563922 RepID=UPI0011B69C90|nr:hypothetical protein [Streptomyces sp. ICBB 8177]